jgi:hypothetical protein
MARHQVNKPIALAGKKGIAADYQRVGPLFSDTCEHLIQLAFGAGVQDV